MRPATLEFVRQRFTQYYREGHLIAPPSLEEREWAFIYFETAPSPVGMHRHIGFSGKRELFDYIRGVVPAHVYYSSAYYADPGASTMAEKTWCGADLIFDLDADHIMRGPYHLMLQRVKEETMKLLEMLTGELGFGKDAVRVVFSGGRGYHIHVTDISIRSWGSRERREVVDYVRGTGIDGRTLLSWGNGDHRTGWRRRFTEVAISYLQWLKGQGEDEALRHLTAIQGVGEVTAREIIGLIPEAMDALERGDGRGALWTRGIRVILSEKNAEFRRRLDERAALADEPVTTDTKRLIRMPTSLHGGSGLRVTPLSAGDLVEFDPLIDAVVFGNRPVEIEPLASLSVQFLGEDRRVERGRVEAVPEALAVFLCCRGLAEIAGGAE